MFITGGDIITWRETFSGRDRNHIGEERGDSGTQRVRVNDVAVLGGGSWALECPVTASEGKYLDPGQVYTQ